MCGIAAAIAAVEARELVVYPTETVYGIGGDATDTRVIEAVYQVKRRTRHKPLSVAVPTIAAVNQVANPTDRTRQFMEEFLPGPFTVVCERRSDLPEALTGGRERVGIRIPDHPLAQELLNETPPLTATSANRSGGVSATRPDELDPAIREGVSAIIDGGQTGGVASTVVDVDREEIHRRGAHANAVEEWFDQATSP